MTEPTPSQSGISAFHKRLKSCRHCETCVPPLPHRARPVFQIDPRARILIASQAPGNLAHQSGVPFLDPSGRRLRTWLGLSEAEFYNPKHVAIVPMGFCFPGYDKNGGDKPPRKECAPLWREEALTNLPNIELKLLIGGYAQKWHLKENYRGSVGRTVDAWKDFWPEHLPLPHPSWRNNAWLKRHHWLEADVIPLVQRRVRACLDAD